MGRALLVALDIDGTLLRADDSLDPAVVVAVRRLAALDGVHVVISTGRSSHATLPVLDRLGLHHGWAVCSNGAVTLRLDPSLPDGRELTDVVTFDPLPVVRALRATLPTALFAVEDAGEGMRVSAPFPDGELSEPWRVVDAEDLVARPVSRVVMRDPGSTPEVFLQMTAGLGLHGVSFAVGWTAWLDLAPAGVSKASALEQVRLHLGVAADETVAFGDGRNDLEMFAWARLSVAMGQAPPEVLAAADEIGPPVTGAGLAPRLQRLADVWDEDGDVFAPATVPSAGVTPVTAPPTAATPQTVMPGDAPSDEASLEDGGSR